MGNSIQNRRADSHPELSLCFKRKADLVDKSSSTERVSEKKDIAEGYQKAIDPKRGVQQEGTSN
jgi:hypothetical protein